MALGHTRLAILDPSPAGAQPMHSHCGRYVLALNGEIYNHRELRSLLANREVTPQWRGNSDTETLLAVIAHWGIDDALRRAKGMFAFALWDRRSRRLTLACDRMGEKPLYWGRVGDSLVFASELKALERHPRFEAPTSREALTLFLRHRFVPAPWSIYEGVQKLEPGTLVCVEADQVAITALQGQPLHSGDSTAGIAIKRYWSLADEVEEGAAAYMLDEQEALQAVHDTLSAAVRRQMLSDVPLGAFLSGGIDSSLIVALMQEHSARKVQTFTIGFDQPDYDEAPFAAAVAAHLHTDHHEMRLDDRDALAIIPELPTLYDEPFADSSQIAAYLVSRAARSQLTVALSGDGGDEVFGGYNRYVRGPDVWRRAARFPTPVRRLAGSALGAVSAANWDRAATWYARAGRRGPAATQFGDRVHRLGVGLRRARSLDELYFSMVSEWADPSRLLSDPVVEPPTSLHEDFPARGVESPAMRLMYQDLRSYLPGDILCKVDRAAMGVSLETRAPFLDVDVVRLALRLPADFKVREGRGKWPLRQILARYVPDSLTERPKSGFSIPLGHWLRGPLRDWAEELLSPDALAQGGLLQEEPIRAVWETHLQGDHNLSPRLWNVLMFQAWTRRARDS